MKTVALPLLLAIALLTAMLPVAGSARAGAATDPPSTSDGFTANPGADVDSWVGVVGMAICGVGINVIRFNPVLGMNPYVLAGTIGGCILVALDIAASGKHT